MDEKIEVIFKSLDHVWVLSVSQSVVDYLVGYQSCHMMCIVLFGSRDGYIKGKARQGKAMLRI